MAYVPTEAEARRLEKAVDLAAFSEVERILWLSCFALLVVLDLLMIMIARSATWVGVVGSAGCFLLLYARLRAVHLAGLVRGDRGLFGPGLATREQRAFTALMFRHVLLGRNPLRPRPEHDPRRWDQHRGRYLTDEELSGSASA